MEVLTLYPAPNPNDATNKREWIPTEPLKEGEYDLVNISFIGFDPNTNMTYDECQAAWSAALAQLVKEVETLRWWQIRRRLAFGRRALILQQRQGMGF